MKNIRGLFPGKKRPLLGIDISPTAIKLLQLSQHRGGHYRVEHYATASLPNGAITENRITDSQGVSLGIKRALKQSGSTTRRAVVAVSGSSVMTKTIQMPKGLSTRELENRMVLEAEQHIPFPIEEVNIDFALLGAQP